MITFERVTQENLYIANEMINSNSSYFEAEFTLKKREIELGLLTSNQGSLLIKVEDTYIGLTSFIEHKEEQLITMNFLIIHADYQGFGYGTMAYYELENLFKNKGIKKIRLNVCTENHRAKLFWERNGYVGSGDEITKVKAITFYEKSLK